MSLPIPIRAVPTARTVRVLRQGPQALLIDTATQQMAACAWSDVEDQLVATDTGADPAHTANLPARYPAGHEQLRADSPLMALFDVPLPQRPRRHPVSFLIIKLTSYCPLRCTYCYDYDETDPVDIATEDLERTLTEAIALAGPDGLQVCFHGGEPLSKFQWLEQGVRHAEAEAQRLGKRVGFHVQTSGAVMNGRIADFLAEHRVSIGLSLDGPPAVNDIIRIMPDGGGSSAIVERQLQRYGELFQRQATILCTVSRLNVGTLEKVVQHFASRGFRAIDFSLFAPLGRGQCNSQMEFDAPDYIAAMKRIVALAEDGALDDIEVAGLTRLLDKLLQPAAHHHCRPSDGPCGAANGVLNLQANGALTGCDLLRAPEYVLGQVGQVSLREALESPQAQHTRSRYGALLQCHRCTWKTACGGTCGASSPSHTGLDPMECLSTQALLEHLAWRLMEGEGLLRYYLRWRESSAAAAAPAQEAHVLA